MRTTHKCFERDVCYHLCYCSFLHAAATCTPVCSLIRPQACVRLLRPRFFSTQYNASVKLAAELFAGIFFTKFCVASIFIRFAKKNKIYFYHLKFNVILCCFYKMLKYFSESLNLNLVNFPIVFRA